MTLRALSAAAMMVVCLLAVSCGGGTRAAAATARFNCRDWRTRPSQRLRRSRRPSRSAARTCRFRVPADFPKADVPVPPDFVLWSVTRSPYLHLVGTVAPPDDPSGRHPWDVVSQAIIGLMQQHGWTFSLNTQVEGADYDFTSIDGRSGHFYARATYGMQRHRGPDTSTSSGSRGRRHCLTKRPLNARNARDVTGACGTAGCISESK